MKSATHAYKQAAPDRCVDQLIVDTMDYVRKIVSTLTVGLPDNLDRENLEQSAFVALVECARSYESNRGTSFRTYCYPRIRGAVIDELRRNSPLPQKMLKNIREVKTAYERLPGPVSPEDLADETNMSLEKIHKVLEAMRFVQPEPWNDLHCNIHENWRTGEDGPEFEAQQRELKRVMADCIERLPDRERLVLSLYYDEDLTLAEIGRMIDRSESRISIVLAAATFRLKELVQASM